MPEMITMAIGKQLSVIMVLVLVTSSFLLIWVPQVSAADPVTTVTIGVPNYESLPIYVNDQTEFTLAAAPDTGASITSSWYKWDDNPLVQYTTAFTAAVIIQIPGGPPAVPMELTAGLHTLYYNSSDDLGNHESPRSLMIYVDPADLALLTRSSSS